LREGVGDDVHVLGYIDRNVTYIHMGKQADKATLGVIMKGLAQGCCCVVCGMLEFA